MLEELLTLKDCARCKICCHFQEDELFDAPTFTEEQKQYILDVLNIKVHFNKKNKIYQIVLDEKTDKGYKCPLLSENGCILPKYMEPFDCESWPFYVMRKGKNFVITVSCDCPAFNKIPREQLVEYIRLKFKKEAIKIIMEYPDMITEYNRELDILYNISKSDFSLVKKIKR